MGPGYVERPNCMRELIYAVALGKKIVVMLEPDPRREGITLGRVCEQS